MSNREVPATNNESERSLRPCATYRKITNGRWLANYQRLKQSIEAICELNHELLRPDEAAAGSRRKRP